MRVRIKLKNLMHWLGSQITLRRKWYLYILLLFAFLICSYYYRDLYFLQVGVTLFSMAIVYLVMETSNIELRETTEKQINAFVSNLQTVCSELKNVSNGIIALTSVMKEVQKTIMESTLASKEALAREDAEKGKRKELIKPQLSTRVDVKGFQFWIFDNRNYHLVVRNSGNDAIGTIIRIRNLEFGAFNIGIRMSIDIDIGRISSFGGISSLNVQIDVRDIDRNLYRGDVQVSLPQPQWVFVPLAEM